MSSKHGLTAIAESNTGAIHCSQEAPNLEDSCGCRGAHSQEDWYVCIPSTVSNKYYSSKSYCKHNLIAENFYPARKRKRKLSAIKKAQLPRKSSSWPYKVMVLPIMTCLT